MLLEVAAAYGVFRGITDAYEWLRRPRSASQAVVPAQQVLPTRDERGRFRSQRDAQFEDLLPHPTEITEFEMTIRGRTHSFR